MAKTLTYYKFYAEDRTLVIEPLFKLTDVLTDDVNKDNLIRAILCAGLDMQRPDSAKVEEHFAEMKRTGGYGKLLDDLTVGYRITDGETVYEVRTRPGRDIDEFEKLDFSLDAFWDRLIDDAVTKIRTFPVEATLTEHEYQKAVAYPFRLSLEELQRCPLRVTRKDFFQPTHIEDGECTNRVDVFTEQYTFALLDDDYRVVASVPVSIDCIRATDDGELEFRITHEKDNVCFEGGLPVGQADTVSGFLNMKVAEVLQSDENILLRHAETEAYRFTDNLPRRQMPYISHTVTYETDQGLKESNMVVIEKGLELSSVRSLLVAEALRSLDKALEGDFERLNEEVFDPRAESPVNEVLKGLNVSLTDGETVYEASIPAIRHTLAMSGLSLCRHISDELTLGDTHKVQNIIELKQEQSQEQSENMDIKSFRLK